MRLRGHEVFLFALVHLLTLGSALAVITSPPPGTTLPSDSVTFSWTAVVGANGYWLDVGTAVGVGNISSSEFTLGTSYTATRLPADGSTVYVQLFARTNGTWQAPLRYTYTAAPPPGSRATLSNPPPGSTLPGPVATFSWTPGAGADGYWLDVGSAFGQGDISSSGLTLGTSHTASTLPTNGSTVYVELFARTNGTWQTPLRYTYTAAPPLDPRAVLRSPPPGATLGGATATFSWTPGTGADAYWLDVGTIVGLGNISAGLVATNFQAVGNLPVNGGTFFVRLWTRIDGVWQTPLDYTYKSGAAARFFRVAGPVVTSITKLRPDGTLVWTNTPTNATFTVQTTSSLLNPTNWVDYLQVPVTNPITSLPLYDPHAPAGLSLVPAGSFTMGDTFGEGGNFELPLHPVYVSAFYMDQYEVTKALWEDVAQWAVAHGYAFEYGALGKANTHPVHTVTWYDAVKWCNARSEKEGRTPAYYTTLQQTNVYRSGQTNVQNDWVKWDAGYRLPTEAEWEKAARGGPAGHRFPWTDTDQIAHSRANYVSATNFTYDASATRGSHPSFSTGLSPFTSPGGYFAANAYGLYDLAGNVWEWCWDVYGPYAGGAQTDPRGPTSGANRVNRGGSWLSFASDSRAANRYYFSPTGRGNHIGFRSVLPPGQ